MSTRRLLKRTLGPQFSEGARQLWVEMMRRRWTQKRLAVELGEEDSGKINRWLFGDRRPGREPACVIEDKLGINPRVWDDDPAEPFEIPESIDVDGDADDTDDGNGSEAA